MTAPQQGARGTVTILGEVIRVRRALGSRASGEPVSITVLTDDQFSVQVPLMAVGVTWTPAPQPRQWRRGDVVESAQGDEHLAVRGDDEWLCTCAVAHTDEAVTADVDAGGLVVVLERGKPVAA
jgi:hypothetical protein